MDDEDRMLLVLDRLDHGAWDTVPEALDNADNWRRAGRVPGGIASNIAAMSANMLRDRAKKQIATLRTDFFSARQLTIRQTAAAPPRLWLRWSAQWSSTAAHCWKLNWQKKCWTMQTWST